jgi:hypothetical protein
MKHSIDNRRYLMAAIVCLQMLCASGCGRLHSKACCPVYLPRNHFLGSEAIRTPPCAPDCQFYGLKKTAWREWPVEWQHWQPTQCPPCAMEVLPYETTELAEPPAHEHQPSTTPPVDQAPAKVRDEAIDPSESTVPQRRLSPLELFPPVEEDEGAAPGALTPDVKPLEPGPMPGSDMPVAPPQEATPGSAESSSWSAPSVPGRTTVPASQSTQYATLSSLINGSESAVRTNTRAPRPSKFRR